MYSHALKELFKENCYRQTANCNSDVTVLMFKEVLNVHFLFVFPIPVFQHQNDQHSSTKTSEDNYINAL